MSTIDAIRQHWPQLPLTGISPRDIPNVGRDDLSVLFASLNYTRGVEIGTELGYYAETLCQANPRLHLTCVDPYQAYKGYREHKSQRKLNEFYEDAQRRLRPYNCDFIRLSSTAASVDFRDESLDFVYIDANHGLMHVIQDLCHWVPKVRSGGIISGHDMIRRDHTGYMMHVVQAVYAYTDAYGVDPWFILGTKAIREGEIRDRPRSFMWVKA